MEIFVLIKISFVSLEVSLPQSFCYAKIQLPHQREPEKVLDFTDTYRRTFRIDRLLQKPDHLQT